MTHIEAPAGGAKIVPGEPVPDNPIIPFIEGDGIGVDITPAMRKVVDAAVEKAYGDARRIHWMEIYAGEKATRVYGSDVWLPEETIAAAREYSVSIKGPMTTPIGGGIRSLNVALRQELDLFVCLRPIRHFPGVPSPLKDPSQTNMVIFRENTEDIYAGIEWEAESPGARKVIDFLQNEMGVRKIRFPETSSIGIKPVSREGTERLVRKAIEYAIANARESVTLVHKGNIMKFTEGGFRKWGYELAKAEFGEQTVTWAECGGNPPPGKLLIKDCIADNFLQEILLMPADHDVVASCNLNGDYISDACAAQVGGLGMAPGANIGDGYGVFEATHGTAPKYADQDVINPSSVILSGAMMFRYIGWKEVAKLIEDGITETIRQKRVTYDLHRQMEGAVKLKTSEFAKAIAANMG